MKVIKPGDLVRVSELCPDIGPKLKAWYVENNIVNSIYKVKMIVGGTKYPYELDIPMPEDDNRFGYWEICRFGPHELELVYEND